MMKIINIPPNEVLGKNDCKRQQNSQKMLQNNAMVL